jgi:uncharacterized membrane protein
MRTLRTTVAVLALVGVSLLPSSAQAANIPAQPIYAQNNTCHPIWVAARYAPPGSTTYINQGWWRVNPGQKVLIFYNNVQYIYFYAHDDHGLVWSGNDACGKVGGEELHMFQMDTGTDYCPWTMNFNP